MTRLRQLLLVLPLFFTIIWSTPSKAQDTTVQVGIILPLSGAGASVGDAIRNGMTIGLEQLDAGVRKRIEVFYEDDALLPKNTVVAFQKLVATNKVDLVICAGSAAGKAIAPLAEQLRIPLIAIASDHEIVRDRTHVVNFWVTPEEEVRVLVPEMVRRNYKKVAIISATHDGPISIMKNFDQMNQGKFEVVLAEDYPQEARDFRAFIAKLRTKEQVDAILILLYAGQNGLFAKQLRQQKLDIPLIGVEFFEDADEVKSSEGALVGHWFVNYDEPNDEFMKKFKERFPNSSTMAAGNGHDVILLIGAAVAKDSKREALNTFLHTVSNFSGALGTFSASGDNRFTLPAAVKIVTDDGFKKVAQGSTQVSG